MNVIQSFYSFGEFFRWFKAWNIVSRDDNGFTFRYNPTNFSFPVFDNKATKTSNINVFTF